MHTTMCWCMCNCVCDIVLFAVSEAPSGSNPPNAPVQTNVRATLTGKEPPAMTACAGQM